MGVVTSVLILALLYGAVVPFLAATSTRLLVTGGEVVAVRGIGDILQGGRVIIRRRLIRPLTFTQQFVGDDPWAV
jgi:hypothetical protein